MDALRAVQRSSRAITGRRILRPIWSLNGFGRPKLEIREMKFPSGSRFQPKAHSGVKRPIAKTERMKRNELPLPKILLW